MDYEPADGDWITVQGLPDVKIWRESEFGGFWYVTSRNVMHHITHDRFTAWAERVHGYAEGGYANPAFSWYPWHH